MNQGGQIANSQAFLKPQRDLSYNSASGQYQSNNQGYSMQSHPNLVHYQSSGQNGGEGYHT